MKSYSLVILLLIFHELESSAHVVSKTIESKWGTFASTSLKDYGRLLVVFYSFIKKAVSAVFFTNNALLAHF